MNGISISVDKSDRYLDLIINPAEVEDKLSSRALFEYIKTTEYGNFFLFEDTINVAFDNYKRAVKVESKSPINERIGERLNAEVKFNILEGEMSAVLAITNAYGGKLPTLKGLMTEAKKVGIVRGISRKRIKKLLLDLKTAKPGEVLEATIAKALPPRNGRSSKLHPLVSNALDRILRPQSAGNDRVDMRNLGAIICVKMGAEILRRLPPKKGRAGYTVTGVPLDATGGSWVAFKPGENTVISDHDENLLLANINGMPKFKDQKMWVDDTFICTGVNVGTGNINYNGAVLVNGDVTEKMIIEATGDVTVNGFVESATIIAGGDIIITEGAMGKVNDANTEYSSKLISQGSIHIQHGQGLDIKCKGNVTIGRQLAYSRIDCKGGLTVGPIDRPNGNLFACDIHSHETVIAGTLGAVSGSNLSIDFSKGFNSLLERKDTLDDLVRQIEQNNLRHKDRMELINSKLIPKSLKHKLKDVLELFSNETQLMQWLQTKADEMKLAKDTYQENIQLVATKRLYPGVVVKLNNRTWRADREYARAKINYADHQWQYEPLL
jgi:uncharacterized protein (DUF342 family)